MQRRIEIGTRGSGKFGEVQCITGASEPDTPYRNKEAEAVVQMQVKISCRRKTKDLFGFNFYFQ